MSGSHILEAYTNQVENLTNGGYIPRVHFLYNEASVSLKKYNQQENIVYQLVPLHIHSVNAAERSIRTCKYRVVALLASTDTRFTMHMCCRLIP